MAEAVEGLVQAAALVAEDSVVEDRQVAVALAEDSKK